MINVDLSSRLSDSSIIAAKSSSSSLSSDLPVSSRNNVSAAWVLDNRFYDDIKLKSRQKKDPERHFSAGVCDIKELFQRMVIHNNGKFMILQIWG